MKERGEFEHLYRVFAPLADSDECRTCRLCEEQVGLVYLLGGEAEIIRGLRRDIIAAAEGIDYIRRSESGHCVCFKRETGRCTIYSDRPLCCRIYPLDLVALNGNVWWVLHKECRIAKRLLKARQVDLVIAMTIAAEERLGSARVQQWMVEERISGNIEAFAYEPISVLPLRRWHDVVSLV